MRKVFQRILALTLTVFMIIPILSVSTFAVNSYTITYVVQGVSGTYTTQTVEGGQSIGTFPAEPTVNGKSFVRWYYMDTTQTPPAKVTATTSLVPTGNITLIAEMADDYVITYAISGQGTYNTQTVKAGQSIGTFPTEPTVNGKSFVRWYYMDTTQTSPVKVTATTSFVPTSDITLLAEFSDKTVYNIEYVSGSGVQTSTAGDTVTLSATPNEGYQFIKWLVYMKGDKTTVITVNNNTFIMPEFDITVEAIFEPISYTITASAGNGGTITPKTAIVKYGESTTFTITPNSGYSIKQVYVDDKAVGAKTSYTFNNVNASHTISATFELDWIFIPPIFTHTCEYGEWMVVTEPTCTKAGEERRTCINNCGKYETRSIDALGHKYGDWSLTKFPGEATIGERQRVCEHCGNIETQTLQSLGAGYKFPFSDVSTDTWYYSSIRKANMLGLINGKTEDTYCPDDYFTVAEALKIAACMNQYYSEGEITLKPGNGLWYDSYVKYCTDNGIWSKDYADYNANITREEYIAIFANAIPESALKQINSVNDGAIPDVDSESEYGKAAYKMYRAGIIVGRDEAGTFDGSAAISRAEVAAVVERMMDESARKNVTLK